MYLSVKSKVHSRNRTPGKMNPREEKRSLENQSQRPEKMPKTKDPGKLNICKNARTVFVVVLNINK